MAGKKSKIISNETIKKIECLNCGKEKASTHANFYNNTHPLFSNCDKFPVCKECITNYIGEKDATFINRVYMMLSLLDRPFIPTLWESTDGIWSKYVTQVSSLPQYKGLTYKDSIFENNKSIISFLDEIDSVQEFSQEVLSRWEGFEPSKIRKLENFYQELISTYEHGTPIQRNLYRNIAITQIQANDAIANSDHKKYKELMDTLSRLMNDANIKPVQETGAEANGISSFGEFIKMVEETEPIPEPRDEFKDVDGIGKYIDKWFLHHMRRFLGLTNETMEEYDEKMQTVTKED